NAANQSFDFERALENYRVLAESPRFAAAKSAQIQDRRDDALINSAIISDRLQRYKSAQTLYSRVYREINDPDERRTALYRIAEMDFERGAWQDALGGMQNFIRAYDGDAKANDLTMLARWRIAQIHEEQRDSKAHERALQNLVDVFRAKHMTPGSLA